jgi:O-antigen/teichoic acid export membrane protein
VDRREVNMAMKFKESQLYKFFSDVAAIGTSAEKIKELGKVPLYSNAFFLITANVCNAIFGFVFWIVVARFYTAEQVGLASATIAGMGFVVAVSRFGLEMALVRFLQQSQESAFTTINIVLTIGLIMSVVVAFVFIIGLGLWSPALIFIRENPVYLAAFMVFCAAATLSVFADYTCIAERKSHLALWRSLIFGFLKIPLAVLLARVLVTFGIFSSWGIALLIALFISMLIFLPHAHPGYHFFFTFKGSVVQDMMKFAFANYVATFLWSAPGMVFPIMVLNMLGAEANAYFYVAWAIGGVLTMIPTSVATSLFAEGSYDGVQLKSHVSRSLKMAGILLVPAVVLVVVLADKLLLLFGGSYSESAASLLRILALGALPMSVNSIFIGTKQVQKDLKALLGLTAFAAAVALGMALVLVPQTGIEGAGIGWVIGQSVAALLVVGIFAKGRHLI